MAGPAKQYPDRVQAPITTEMGWALDEYAESQGMTRASALRQILQEALGDKIKQREYDTSPEGILDEYRNWKTEPATQSQEQHPDLIEADRLMQEMVQQPQSSPVKSNGMGADSLGEALPGS